MDRVQVFIALHFIIDSTLSSCTIFFISSLSPLVFPLLFYISLFLNHLHLIFITLPGAMSLPLPLLPLPTLFSSYHLNSLLLSYRVRSFLTLSYFPHPILFSSPYPIFFTQSYFPHPILFFSPYHSYSLPHLPFYRPSLYSSLFIIPTTSQILFMLSSLIILPIL